MGAVVTLPVGLVATVSPAASPYPYSFTNGAALTLDPAYVSSSTESNATLTGTSCVVQVRFYFLVGASRTEEPRRALDLSWTVLFDGTDVLASGDGDSDILITRVPADAVHDVSGYTFGDPSFRMTPRVVAFMATASAGAVEPTMTGSLRTASSQFKKGTR